MTAEYPRSLCNRRYLLVSQLGEGGMAAVFRGYDVRLKAWRAVKLMAPHLATKKKLRQRFEGEAQTMAMLEHRNIVRVYDVGEDSGTAFIVMELIEGGCLVDWLEDHGTMPPKLAVECTLQTAEGLHAAHKKGIIHRDIKPHNVLVTTEGKMRVTDFGIARINDGDMSMTKTGAVMGTWGYMAPEQRSDAKSVDARADEYALAATLYSLLTNKTPMDLFAADRDASMMAGIPKSLVDVLIKATEYRREDRYDDVMGFADALREILPGLPDDPPDTPPIARKAGEPPPIPDPFDFIDLDAPTSGGNETVGWMDDGVVPVGTVQPEPAGTISPPAGGTAHPQQSMAPGAQPGFEQHTGQAPVQHPGNPGQMTMGPGMLGNMQTVAHPQGMHPGMTHHTMPGQYPPGTMPGHPGTMPGTMSGYPGPGMTGPHSGGFEPQTSHAPTSTSGTVAMLGLSGALVFLGVCLLLAAGGVGLFFVMNSGQTADVTPPPEAPIAAETDEPVEDTDEPVEDTDEPVEDTDEPVEDTDDGVAAADPPTPERQPDPPPRDPIEVKPPPRDPIEVKPPPQDDPIKVVVPPADPPSGATEDCLKVKAPAQAGPGATFSVKVCSDISATPILYWRDVGSGGWKSAQMPKRLGSNLAKISDDNHAKGVEYYIVAGSVSYGSAGNPKVIR